MYKSSLRHIYDPVLSSLKMKGICFIFIPPYFGDDVLPVTNVFNPSGTLGCQVPITVQDRGVLSL
jgi:hypothetical protein